MKREFIVPHFCSPPPPLRTTELILGCFCSNYIFQFYPPPPRYDNLDNLLFGRECSENDQLCSEHGGLNALLERFIKIGRDVADTPGKMGIIVLTTQNWQRRTAMFFLASFWERPAGLFNYRNHLFVSQVLSIFWPDIRSNFISLPLRWKPVLQNGVIPTTQHLWKRRFEDRHDPSGEGIYYISRSIDTTPPPWCVFLFYFHKFANFTRWSEFTPPLPQLMETLLDESHSRNQTGLLLQGLLLALNVVQLIFLHFK